MKTNLRTFLAALSLLALFALVARATTVTAVIDPPEVSMGDSAQLTITVSGAQGAPAVPRIDGLDITPVGTSTQVEIVNGSMTANASTTYNITPQREGTFTIPAIRAGNAESKPVTLRVVKGNGASANSQPAPNQSGPVVQPNAAPQGQQDQPTTDSAGRYGVLQVAVPRKELYTGELVPMDIRLILPQNLQPNISDLPKLDSDGFTMNSLSTKPQQGEQIINGRVCIVITWHTAITAVKPGDYNFSLQEPITVVEQQRIRDSDGGDPFRNFFRNAFAVGTKKSVTLQNEALQIKVLALPTDNKPADFSGAVGQFEVLAEATPDKVNAGDPITLKLKITGTGNFDRVSSDLLASGGSWKTYSSKSHFDGTDSVGYQGTKTFEQPVIPSDSSVTSIPSLAFSFFDPEKHLYITRTTPPIPISVTGGVAAAPSPTPSASANPAPTPTAVPPAADGLRANKIESGEFASTLRPVYLSPVFIAAQSLPLIALLAGLAFIRGRRASVDPSRTRATAAQAAIKQQLAAMDDAMKNQQIEAFFIHARAALQQQLGQRWNMRPETITLAEIERHMGEGSENIRAVFEMADQASYSNLQFQEADLRQWREVVLHTLAEKN